MIFDAEHHNYQLYRVGWEGLEQVHYCVFHIDNINDKIWVQEDATDYDIVGVLEEELGIPKEDIVWLFIRRIKGRIRDMQWRESNHKKSIKKDTKS